MTYEFKLPDIGEGLHEAEIIAWFIKPGDKVKENDNLVEVQTDKAVAEISSPVTGIVKQLGAETGEVLKVGEVLVFIEPEDSGRLTTKGAPQAEPQREISFAMNTDGKESKEKHRVIASPAVRKLARELGINMSDVIPTGKGGRVTREDLQTFVHNQQQKTIEVSSETTEVHKLSVSTNLTPQRTHFEEEESREPIRGLRKIIFQNMVKSKFTATHCTGVDEFHVDRLIEIRKQMVPYAERKGVKLTYLAFIVKAVSRVLKDNPIFNASVDEEKMEIIYKNYIHIGIATATDAGLLVPIIRNADQKSVLEIAAGIQDYAEKARQRKLKPEELSGSTFTISSTGGNGGWYGTPIINYPEVAILGVHSIRKKPIVIDDEIVIGNMMGTSFTFDHRIIDGEPVGRFMNQLREFIENPQLLILEGR